MNARARVSTTRQQLSAAVIGASLGWGLAVAMILLLLAALGDLVFGLAYEIRVVTRIGAIALGVVAALVVLLRNRGAWHIEGVALWLEEKAPNLNYALVTLIQGAGGSIAALEQHVAQVDWRAPVRRRIGRGTVPPAPACVDRDRGIPAAAGQRGHPDTSAATRRCVPGAARFR
jgi:hypothetical protein